MKYPRVSIDPSQMGGVPCIWHLRIPVTMVLKLIAQGSSFEEILRLYPDLEIEDIRKAVAFAAQSVEEREISLAS